MEESSVSDQYVCNACGVTITPITDKYVWTIVVTSPEGVSTRPQAFCLGCISTLAVHGLSTELRDVTS